MTKLQRIESNGEGLIQLIERIATNKEADVEKLERLIQLQRDVMKDQARAAFAQAFAEMQPHLPVVEKRGTSHHGRYARNEDIQEAVRPVLATYGFSLTFKTHPEATDAEKIVRLTGILKHSGGHEESTEFILPADTSGKKNPIQSLASSQSYGIRYCTIALLNIITRGVDDDGESAQIQPDIETPDGFTEWWEGLEAWAQEGTKALEGEWKASPVDFRNHVTKTNMRGWRELKALARDVRK